MDALHSQFGRTAVLVIVGILCVSIIGGVASAQEQRTGSTVTVGPDEVHQGDLEATGGDVYIEGTVDGDLATTGGSVTITGNVTGDLTVTAGSTIIAGNIDGDLRTVGGDIHIRERATIGGATEATGGTITVDGTLADDTQLSGDSITVGPTATIDGDLAYSAETVDISDDAEISGELSERDNLDGPAFSDVSLPDIPDIVVTPLIGLYLFLANFVLGAVLLVAAPRFSDHVSEQGVDRPVLSGGVGLATLIGMPFLIGALFISIVGIPLAFFASYSFFFAVWVGLVYGAFVVGTWGLSLFDVSHQWGALALGLAIVSLLNALPYVGFVLVIIALVGMGAFARALYKWRTNDDGDDAESDGAPPFPAVREATQ
jgi:cytoskeletal protein CcmA (bactofilin family)